MRSIPLFIVTAVLAAFGLLTTFLTGSILLDLFGIRSHEGNYVLIVVWANLISGVLFLTAAFAFFKRKSWAALPLIVSAVVLIFAFAGLMIHIDSGAPYETKTIGAMIFRLTVNLVLAVFVYSSIKKQRTPTLIKSGLLALVPLAFVAAGCGHVHDKDYPHGEMERQETQLDEGTSFERVKLNNGEKWKADENTLSVAAQMNALVSDFEEIGKKNHHILADSLRKQLDALVAGCTMKGPAHDELHKWLVLFSAQVKELSRAQNELEAGRALTGTKKSLEVFEASFE